MITQRHRFHGYGSLKRVYAHGQSVRGGLLGLKFNERGPGRPYRCAVVVSRKVHKSAVTRNRIRRRIYEIVRQREADITPGSDLIFTAFSDQLAEMPSGQLEAMVAELLGQTGSSRVN